MQWNIFIIDLDVFVLTVPYHHIFLSLVAPRSHSIRMHSNELNELNEDERIQQQKNANEKIE